LWFNERRKMVSCEVKWEVAESKIVPILGAKNCWVRLIKYKFVDLFAKFEW
jgi:hypothetical protein